MPRTHANRQMPPRFLDETSCELYLVHRLRNGLRPCLKCGVNSPYIFSARRVWQCSGCQTRPVSEREL